MSDSRQLQEALAAVRQSIVDRRASDSLFQFVPTAKQRPFIASVFGEENFENWFVAANRSGKSEAGAYLDACFARFGMDPHGYSVAKGSNIEVRDRAASIWVSSVTFNETRDVMQPKIFDNGFVPPGARAPFIPQREIQEWRVSDKILKLKNGSIIGFKSAEAGRSAYQGAAKDVVHFDEEHEKSIYNEACIRIGAGRRLRVYGTATLLPPEGNIGGVTWVYSEILKPFLEGKLSGIGCFGASMYDNPHLLPEDIAKAESKYPPESTEGRIRIGGEWLPGLSGSRAYPMFDSRIHVKVQNEPQPRRPLVWMWDFNIAPLISIVGQRDGRLFRVFKEFVMEDSGNVPEMCDVFRDFYPRHYGELWVYGDATGQGRNPQTSISDYRTIQNHMRAYPAPVKLKIPNNNPPVPDRISAVNRALKNEEGETMIEIDPSCVELIADLEQVLRSPLGGIKKSKNSSDPYFKRTHASDAFGYWVSYEEPIRRITEMDRYRVSSVPAPAYAFAR